MALTDRVALVSGGGTGLGRAIGLALAEAGCHVAVNYSRSQSEAEETAAAVREKGRRAMTVQADVSDDGAARGMVERVVGELGGLDILVNNAGTTRYAPLTDLEALTTEVWDSILGTNLKGPFFCARAAAPHLKKSGRGKVINTASSSAFQPTGSSIAYMCSKAGLVMLTKALARALAPEVQVNGIAPGWLADTRWVDVHIPPDVKERIFANASAPPAGVEECARVAIMLAETDAISGQTIIIDRGVTMA